MLLSSMLRKPLFSVTFDNSRPSLPRAAHTLQSFLLGEFIGNKRVCEFFSPCLLFFGICNEKFSSVAT